MKRQVKALRRAGAWTLAAAMFIGLATPMAAEAAEPVNLAQGKTATASESESGTNFTADKAVDGNANRDANGAQQSRWATNQLTNDREAWLQIDLGSAQAFQSFVIAWERTNITSYSIQISDTANGTDWETVYEKTGDGNISGINENIHLPEQKTAQYVRLYVDGYDGGDSGWKSVSVYEFQIYENDIPDNLLPEENYNLEGTAVANDTEATDDNRQVAQKAIDGDTQTRWASNSSDSGDVEKTLTVTLPASQRVEFFRIIWEKLGIESYKIEVSPDGSDGNYVEVYSTSDPVANVREVVSSKLGPVWAKTIKLTVTRYNGGDTPNWKNVSVAEFEAYAVEPDSIKDDSTPQDCADVLGAPYLNEDNTRLEIPDVVPERFTVEFLADYEQVVEKDGTIHQPLTEKTVKIIYKVTEGEGESAVTAEGTTEHTVVIPGRYDNAGTNAKPVVIPELAEWYGGNESGDFTIGQDTTIYVADPSFTAAAQALADDYNAEMGTNLTVATGDQAAAGDILFTADAGSGLDEEGYIMEINDSLTVKAETNTGAYWATRSILQIAELNNGSIPKGIAKDYPKYEVRSFSLDVARKPASMDSLEDFVDAMAYYKMNDFQVHLNDNLIFYEDFANAEEAREKAYTGFRLESDIKEGGENQADLTNTDLYYTKEEFRQFIETARGKGINIVPEIDTPGHSGAFTKVRPDLMLPQSMAVNGTAERAGEQFDLSGDRTSADSQYGRSLAFVKSVWNEYLTEEMFDSSMTVHIGTDEYYGDANAFRQFSDDMIEFIQDNNRTVRMWGSLTALAGDGTVNVRSDNVQLNVWNTGYSNPSQMYNDGFDLINTLDGSLYMVPNGSGGRGGYGDFLATQNLYNNWTPNKFGNTIIPAGSEQMLGSTFAIWNDNIDTRAQGISEVDNFERFEDALPVLASKNWGEGADLEFADLKEKADALGDAPGSNPYYEAESDSNGDYITYEFADTADSSENGRDISESVNANIENGVLELAGGESYVTTPIDKLATGSSLSFDITLDAPPQAGQILFEADTPGSDDYAHDIRIMDDGRLGFRRELYDYYFDYKLPVGQEVHIEITTDTLRTTLIVDGTEYSATGIYRNRQTDNTVRKENISNATLLLPIQRIGSRTNAVAATIDNVNVKVAQPAVDEFNKAAWTGTADSQYTGDPSSSEGEIWKAYDNNSGTIWHSNWGNNSMKLNCATGGTLDSVTAEIDLGKAYTINQFSFTPRTGTNSGQVTKADLYVKAAADGDWIPVASDQIFADDATQKTFYFDAQEVQYIKFVAKESDDGWVAVSEFDIANTPAQTYTVYVDAQEGGSATGGKTGVAANAEVSVSAQAENGYTFAGWYDAVTGTKVSDEAVYTFPVTENTVLCAYFTENEAPVSFTVTIDGVEQTVVGGEKATPPADNPTKAGHKFLGWFEEGAETAFDFEQPITGNVTLTARFTPYSVTIVEIPGVDITVGNVNDQTGEVTVTAPVREGYNFLGWQINGTMVYGDYSYTFVPSADTQIQAVYEAIAPGTTYYNVTIDGVTTQIAANTVLERPADPVREGYRFIGWYVGGVEYDFSSPVTSDLVIEARFEMIDTSTVPQPGGGSTSNTPVNGGNGAVSQSGGNTSGTSGNAGNRAVETGDAADFAPWAVCFAISAGAVLVLTRRKTNK